VVKSATSNSYWLLKRQREREREQLSAGEVGQEQIPRLWGTRGKSCRHIGSQEEVLLYIKCSGCALERGRKIMGKKGGSTS
jgi:hypothetical protein